MSSLPRSCSDSPARNLTQAFEALCVDEAVDIKQQQAVVSPTGVADLGLMDQVPLLYLHTDLRRDLSQALVNRVSFYGIIHDINKEAGAMAANDTKVVEEEESLSPLVLAAVGSASLSSSKTSEGTPEDYSHALIDEEEWLLSTISTREPSERRACPDTFLQAMGEKEYDNPVTSLSGNTRTQLWKPSRSWWEAKSGKNPWIEPAFHNRRWR
jgi:hypothetical protein